MFEVVLILLCEVAQYTVVCLFARSALDSLSSQHGVELEQARQQAVAEYCAKAVPDTADSSLAADLQASNAVR